MAKTKEFKLPKYLRLAKGIMWMDIEGENCSNVKLYRNLEQFVGRGNDVTTFETKGVNKIGKDDREYKSDKYPEYKPVENKNKRFVPKKDMHDNKNNEHGEYGFVEMKDKSWFCTKDVEPHRLGKIIDAYQNGILIRHDPKTKYGVSEIPKQKKDFRIQHDGDIEFNGTNINMYNMLYNSDLPKIREYIMTAGESARQNLMDLYQYEIKGYNNIARPRAEILDLIRSKLNDLGPGISAITSNDLDDED